MLLAGLFGFQIMWRACLFQVGISYDVVAVAAIKMEKGLSDRKSHCFAISLIAFFKLI